MPQERAMTKRESFEELVREGLITLPRREERRPALSDDEWAARKASYDELVRDGLISDGRSGGIAPVVGAFVGNAMDAAADAVLGVPDVAIDYIGRALMPDNPEASPIRAAVAEGIQRYNPAGMLRDYAKEQSAPMLADVPQKQYDPNAGILDYVFDPYVLAGGLGSMVGYMGSAAASPVGLAGRALSRLPQAARIMNGMTGRALTAMRGGASEGLVEGVGVYDDITERGGSANEAIAAALKTAGLNIPIDMLTNYLGFAAENKLTKGAIAATLNRLTGGRLPAAAIERGANIISQGLSGTLSEGGQETLQSTVSKKYGEGRTWGDVLSPEALRETFVTEGLPGAVVGGVTGGAFGSLAPVRNAEEQGTRSAQTAQPETPSVLSQPQASDAQEAETLAQSQAGQIDETGPQSGANTNAGAAVSAPSGDVDAFIDGVVGEVNAASEGAAANPKSVSEGNAAVVAEAVNAASTGAPEQTRTREPIAQGTPQPDGTVTLKSGGQAVTQPPAQAAANPPSRGMVRYRSNGQLLETPVDYALMEMDDLVTSNTDSGGVNEAYPAEFQPRDRSRVSGMTQVAQMASNLRPELLGADEYADRGAPIVDARGNVISGNGRTMSIRSAYRNMPDTSGARYRSWLAENAASLGLDGAAVGSMRNPVLVRRLTDPELDLRAFAEDANTPMVAGMSASEQAMRDAEHLTQDILSKFVPNDMGDVLTNNGEFVQAFGEMIPPSERERFINREGRLSQDGARRIKNALVAKAYGDAGFLERVSESTDDDMRNLSNALTQAAPAIATAEERMSRGLLDSNLSLRAPLIEAVHELERVREQGGNVAEVLNQQGLFGGQLSDEAKILLQFFDANKRSAKAIRTLLTDYAAAVEEKGDPRQANMFDTESETAAQLLTRMAAKQGKGADGRSIVPSERNQGRIDFSVAEEEQTPQQSPPQTTQRQSPSAQVEPQQPTEPQTSQERSTIAAPATYPIENARSGYTAAGSLRESVEYRSDEESDGSFSVSRITKALDERGIVVSSRREVIESGLDEREADELRGRLEAETNRLADMGRKADNADATYSASAQTIPQQPIPSKSATPKKGAGKREKIEDFGEKIGGARKDMAAEFRERMARKFSEEDIATKPLSEVFPAPDYNALIEAGVDKRTVALVRAVRESIPAKPRGAYRLSGYVKDVKALRGFANELLSNPEFAEKAASRMSEISVLQKRVLDKARLYELLGHNVSLKDYVVQSGEYTVYNGERFAKPTEIWSIRKGTSLTDLGVGRTFEEAAEEFRKHLASGKNDASAKKTDFSIYSYSRSSGKKSFYVGKKVGREYVDLAGPFAKSSEAQSYIDEHNEELTKQLDNFKTVPSERRDENAPRVGVDMRGGEDVTPERFASTFGFRGVEFGNWVEQGRRQADLNDAYDALMDLAAIIGVPPKALSLNGRLGLAFGARGKGGKGSVRINAHYERGYMAINLTKERGAGSLAHEWMHALDDYLGDMLGKMDMASETGRVAFSALGLEESEKDLVGMRPEMLRALGKVYSAVRTETGLEKRSKNLDGRRTGSAYWAKVSEMEARAFEAYIADKLAESGASNDYLVNIVSEDFWRAQNEQLGRGELHDYPYPTVSEMPVVREAFDGLFRTVKTRETAKGAEMYRIAEDAEQRNAALRNAMLYGKPVARLTGEEFQNVSSNLDLANEVYNYFGENYGGKVYRPGIGDIFLTKKGIRNDIGHGIGREKISAFLAVPDILTNGKVLRISPNWKGRGYRSFVIGAPIEIGGERYVAIAVVNEAEDINHKTTHGKFYLHEVALQKSLLNTSDVSVHPRGSGLNRPDAPEAGTARRNTVYDDQRSSADSSQPTRGGTYNLSNNAVDVNGRDGVMSQDIPPDASEVPDQQAYRDAGVVHAATKAGEAAHVHRSSDGPIAASAEAVQLPRGDSSSNGNVPRGDIYTLLNMVINVNGLPEVTAEAIRAAYPFLKVKELERGRLLIDSPGGLRMYLTNGDAPIEINAESFREEYGREVTPDDIATGRTVIMNKQAFIDLVNGVSTMEDVNEEFYHVAENMLLTKKERDILERTYGGEKERADAYRDFVRGRVGQLNARSVPLFQRIKDIFARIRRMIFGPRSEDIFRDIADGRVWNRRALESNGEVARYNITDSPQDGADASGEVGAQSGATRGRPTSSRPDAGAAQNASVEQEEAAVNESDEAAEGSPVQEAAAEYVREAEEAEKEATSSVPAMLGKIVNDVLTIEGDGSKLEGYAASRTTKKREMSILESIDDAWNRHVDDLYPIEKYFGNELYRFAGNALWGIRGPAEYRLFNGDPDRGVKGLVPIYKSLKPEHRRGFSYYAILKNLADIARFSYEAKAKETELREKLKAGGLTKKERKQMMTELNRLERMQKVTMASPQVYDKAVSEIEKRFPEWIEPQKELVKYNQALLDMLADSGIISDGLRNELKRRYPNYVPLQRDFNKEDGLDSFVSSRGMVNVNSPLKRLRGSKRDVIDPMDQILQNTFAFQAVVARQSVAQEIVKGYDEGKYRDLITEVYGKEQYKRMAYEAFEKAKATENKEEAAALNKKGQEYMRMSDHAKDVKYSPEEGVFFVYQNGKKRLFKTDKDIFNALVMSQGGRRSKEDNFIKKLLAIPADALRYGTTHSLTFGVGNMVRDTYSNAVVGKHFRPGVDTVLGALAILTNKELVQDFVKNGGLQGSAWQAAKEYRDMMRELRGVRRETGNELLDKIANSGIFNNKAVNAVLKYNPISLYLKLSEAFAEFSEQASRIGQYKRLLDLGYSKEDAIFETRDNMNFMRGSDETREISKFVPFYGTALQGLDKLKRTVRHDGHWDAKAIARAALWITGTSLLTTAMNYMGDDDDRERYLNLKPWRKNMFWNIVIGDEVFSFPKPFEAGMLFGSLPERFMDYLWQKDKRAFEGLASSIAASLAPDLVALAPSVIFELSSGYSQFYGRQIIPMREQRLDPELQYGPHTAEWAKQVADIMKYVPDFSGVPYIGNLSNVLRSPRMLEYAVLAMTGSAGRDISGVYNRAYRAVHGESRPAENPLLWVPGVRRFFADAKYGGRDQDAFREEMDAIMRRFNSAEDLRKQGRGDELDVQRIRLLQMGQYIKDTNAYFTHRNRGINAANRMIQRITTAPNMTAKQKREAIDQINAYVLAMSREGLMRVEEIKKYLRTDKM